MQITFKDKARADEKAQHTWEYVSILKRLATPCKVSLLKYLCMQVDVNLIRGLAMCQSLDPCQH
jgi:hypothetical protein